MTPSAAASVQNWAELRGSLSYCFHFYPSRTLPALQQRTQTEQIFLQPESLKVLFCLHKLSKCPLLPHCDDALMHKARLIKKWFSQFDVEEHSTPWSWTGTIVVTHTISVTSLIFLWLNRSKFLEQHHDESWKPEAWRRLQQQINACDFGIRFSITWVLKFFWLQRTAH